MFFMVQVVQGPDFYGPGFLWSMFFRVQAQGLGLSSRSSPTLVGTLSYLEEEKM